MKVRIKTLIKENKLLEATQLLESVTTGYRARKSLAQLEARINALTKKNRLGIISNDEASLEMNKIRLSLLELFDDYENGNDKEIIKPDHKYKYAILAAGLLFITVYFVSNSFATPEKVCLDSKVSVLVADFQTVNDKNGTDGFANSLVTRLDNLLGDDIYDVSPIGHQTRKIKRYDNYIAKEYFELTCDTSGVFINGYLNMEQKVFNIYLTMANLKMQIPKLSTDKSIVIDNPKGLEFSISEDVDFLADFILGIIKCYEGEPYEALDQFFELEKKNRDKLLEDNNLKATLAHFKGNCYAMRGDDRRASIEYQKAGQYGNKELKESAKKNTITAKEINSEMKKDPAYRDKLSKNKKEHSNFERDLERFLNKIGNGLVKVFDKIK